MRRACCIFLAIGWAVILVIIVWLRDERQGRSSKIRLVREKYLETSIFGQSVIKGAEGVQNTTTEAPHPRNIRARRKRQADETGECFEETCVEGSCSEDRTKCICFDGFAGENCQYDVNECQSDPCKNDARCVDGVNRFYCNCQEGWTGDDCSEDIDECSSIPCYGRGDCFTPRIAMFVCRCRSGFYGINCENDIEECWSHPCQNGGLCVDMVDRYLCRCPAGFNGTHCEEEIDECATEPCQNGGICIDEIDGFQCQCPGGYLGAECEKKLNLCEDVACENGGQCVEGLLGVSCLCQKGFEGDLCQRETDECVSSPCENSGSCLDMEADYECLCADGFEGRNCEVNINECKSQPCQNSGLCNDDMNGYFCACREGFVGDQCEVDVDECTSDPCKNGAECRDKSGAFICICPRGFEGEICDIAINKCNSYPCQNAGTCHDEPEKFLCECIAGFDGERCEAELNECASAPCGNGGRCVDLVNSYACECGLGFKGDRCQEEENECESNPCQNGGTCIDGRQSFRCDCTQAYEGVACERKVKICQIETCMNGGTCAEENSGFLCTCTSGFEGDRCQTNINECKADSCENGGLCIDDINSFYCLCREGYSGRNCNDSTVAEAQKLSQIMLSVLPAVGILIVCVVAISLTTVCLRRQQSVPGSVYENNQQTTGGASNAINGKVGSRTVQKGSDKIEKNATDRTKGAGDLQQSKTHRSVRPSKHASTEKRRVSKRKKNLSVNEGGEESKKREKDRDGRKKRRKAADETPAAKHHDKNLAESERRKRKSRNSKSQKRSSKHAPNIATDGQGSSLDSHPVRDERKKTAAEMTEKEPRKVSEGSLRPVRPGESLDHTNATKVTGSMKNRTGDKNPIQKGNKPPVGTKSSIKESRTNKYANSSIIQENSNALKEISNDAYDEEESTRDGLDNRKQHRNDETSSKHPLKSSVKNERVQTKHPPRVAESSIPPYPKDTPIYLPVKTANGASLYLPLGTLDQYSANQANPMIPNTAAGRRVTPMTVMNLGVDDEKTLFPRLHEAKSDTKQSPAHIDLSSPWQPVWKYNFPHLLMQDAELQQPLNYVNEENLRREKSRHVDEPTSMKCDGQSVPHAEEMKHDNPLPNGTTKLHKTFLKEEVSMIVKTRERWQSFVNESTAPPKEQINSTPPKGQVLSYSRHFTPPSQQSNKENTEASQNSKLRLNEANRPAGNPAVPKDLVKSISADLWERDERQRNAPHGDEAWEDSVEEDIDYPTDAAIKSRILLNDFGLRNPHGMNRENAFVDGQM